MIIRHRAIFPFSELNVELPGDLREFRMPCNE